MIISVQCKRVHPDHKVSAMGTYGLLVIRTEVASDFPARLRRTSPAYGGTVLQGRIPPLRNEILF